MATAPNFQKPPVGLGSYLAGILPEDIALSAGGFAMAMQQIKNIKNVEFEKFAQVAASIEVTTAGLNLINGTDVPVDLPKVDEASKILQQGSGPSGTYVMSDFFGCMSGLPYPWRELKKALTAVQTTTLANLYQELYLAVTWEQATFVVTTETQAVETSPGSGLYDWQYRITGTTMSDPGGGYLRGGAPSPGGDYTFSTGVLASSGGVLLTANADSNTNNAPGTYGRMINFVVSGTPGSWVTYASSQPSSSPTNPGIQYRLPAPPTSNLGGTNTAYGTAGWPSMNSVVQNYINLANQEITYISQINNQGVSYLNTIYNQFGTQLAIEQRSRYQAISPVPIPRDRFINQYPTSASTFVDNIGTTYSQETRPHMAAQTLEAIANLNNISGQSLVGLMRQERNKARLDSIAVQQDNIVPCSIEDKLPELLSNGTTNTAIDAGINGYTSPASLIQDIDGQDVVPQPFGFFDNTFILTPNTTTLDQTQPIKNLLDPFFVTGAAAPVIVTGAITPTGQGVPIDTGAAKYPGSLAGSKATNLIPPKLNAKYTSGILLPSQLETEDAINQVIDCNCTCWVD